MFGWGDSRLSAWISRRLLTWSKLSKLLFMYLMATYLPFFMHCALSTSEKVPSPFLATSRYSAEQGSHLVRARGAKDYTAAHLNYSMFRQGTLCYVGHYK